MGLNLSDSQTRNVERLQRGGLKVALQKATERQTHQTSNVFRTCVTYFSSCAEICYIYVTIEAIFAKSDIDK